MYTPRTTKQFGRHPVVLKDVFSHITSESAYWLGYIYANGCIVCVNKKPAVLVLFAMPVDREHLQVFAGFIGSKNKIMATPKRNTIMLRQTSKALVETLNKYGITKQKLSRGTVQPSLAASPDFWRGYLDGNSLLTFEKKKTLRLAVQGTEAILEQFVLFIQQRGIALDKNVAELLPTKDEIIFSGKDVVLAVLDTLYNKARIIAPSRMETLRSMASAA
jgi:hypothetical protein